MTPDPGHWAQESTQEVVRMFRKLLGVFTAIATALLVVGAAWASGDGLDDSSSGTVAASAAADVSSSASVDATADTSPDTRTPTSVDDRTSTSVGASSSTSAEADSRTSVSLIDTSTTSTTVDSTTSTSSDVGSTSSTSSTVDDDVALPITTEPTTYDVHGAGTVTIQVVAGSLVLLDANAAAGWSLVVDKADGRDIRVEFESSADADARFEAQIRDNDLRVKIEAD